MSGKSFEFVYRFLDTRSISLCRLQTVYRNSLRLVSFPTYFGTTLQNCVKYRPFNGYWLLVWKLCPNSCVSSLYNLDPHYAKKFAMQALFFKPKGTLRLLLLLLLPWHLLIHHHRHHCNDCHHRFPLQEAIRQFSICKEL